LLILDEPTTGVDRSRAASSGFDQHYPRPLAQMSAAVAAYMDEAQRFDWLMAMDDGKTSPTARCRKCWTRPASLRSRKRSLPCSEQASAAKVIVRPRVAGPDEVPPSRPRIDAPVRHFAAVDHVNFRIALGEIFGFLSNDISVRRQ
jgi:ribosome-dependent ATPase